LYFDESGIDSRLQEEYGYAPCGEKVYAEKSGKREVKTTILACYQYHEKELIQPFSFEGSTDSKIVEFYFEHLYFPTFVQVLPLFLIMQPFIDLLPYKK
jgi:hypothetical protein